MGTHPSPTQTHPTHKTHKEPTKCLFFHFMMFNTLQTKYFMKPHVTHYPLIAVIGIKDQDQGSGSRIGIKDRDQGSGSRIGIKDRDQGSGSMIPILDPDP